MVGPVGIILESVLDGHSAGAQAVQRTLDLSSADASRIMGLRYTRALSKVIILTCGIDAISHNSTHRVKCQRAFRCLSQLEARYHISQLESEMILATPGGAFWHGKLTCWGVA